MFCKLIGLLYYYYLIYAIVNALHIHAHVTQNHSFIDREMRYDENDILKTASLKSKYRLNYLFSQKYLCNVGYFFNPD